MFVSVFCCPVFLGEEVLYSTVCVSPQGKITGQMSRSPEAEKEKVFCCNFTFVDKKVVAVRRQ